MTKRPTDKQVARAASQLHKHGKVSLHGYIIKADGRDYVALNQRDTAVCRGTLADCMYYAASIKCGAGW